MEIPTRVLIIETECTRLIALMLWLGQFGEFQVNGLIAEPDMQEEVLDSYEILLVSENALRRYESILANTLKLRADSPSVFVLEGGERANGDYWQPAIQCEGNIKVDSSFKDLYDHIQTVAARKKSMFNPAWLPAAKAS